MPAELDYERAATSDVAGVSVERRGEEWVIFVDYRGSWPICATSRRVGENVGVDLVALVIPLAIVVVEWPLRLLLQRRPQYELVISISPERVQIDAVSRYDGRVVRHVLPRTAVSELRRSRVDARLVLKQGDDPAENVSDEIDEAVWPILAAHLADAMAATTVATC